MKFKKTKPSQFIVAVEGPDQVGKETQAKKIVGAANRLGFTSATYVEVPIHDEHTHERIYACLKDGKAKDYPSTFQALQVINRIIWQHTVFPNMLSDLVVLDRWNASTFAYGRSSGVPEQELNLLLDLIWEPDATIILDGNPFKQKNSEDTDDVYEKDKKLQIRVRSFYKEWGDINGAMFVDANQEPHLVTRDILNLLRPVVRG